MLHMSFVEPKSRPTKATDDVKYEIYVHQVREKRDANKDGCKKGSIIYAIPPVTRLHQCMDLTRLL